MFVFVPTEKLKMGENDPSLACYRWITGIDSAAYEVSNDTVLQFEDFRFVCSAFYPSYSTVNCRNAHVSCLGSPSILGSTGPSQPSMCILGVSCIAQYTHNICLS